MLIFAIASVVMIMTALVLVIPPLLRNNIVTGPSREQISAQVYRQRISDLEAQQSLGTLEAAQFAQARDDLDREMLSQLDDPAVQPASASQIRPIPAIILAFAMPLIALGIYFQFGTPQLLFDGDLVRAGVSTTDDPSQNSASAQPSIEEMVARLERRMQEQPDDARGWLMLGRSYMIMQRPEQARTALANALQYAPQDPETMVAYAEVLITINKGSLEGEAIDLVQRALSIEKDFPRALWLLGLHALNQGIPSDALSTWQHMLDTAKLDAPVRAQIEQAMASIRSAVANNQGAKPSQTSAANSKTQANAQTNAISASVTLKVALDEQLASTLSGEEILYVFARATSGPPMPLAVERLSVKQLPLTVVLDDSKAMAPELVLSRFENVVVTARISRNGTPLANSGDLQSKAIEIQTHGGQPIELIIDQVVP